MARLLFSCRTQVSEMIEQRFDPQQYEQRIYQRWEDGGCFRPSGDTSAQPYAIMIPPPNVTGSLHMGHALNNTLQDILVRHARMQGKNVRWQPGMDHAGIATQMVVERQLSEAGNAGRRDLGREAFVSRVWEWKEKSGGNILNQLKRLGASCDWENERFTLDEGLSKAVGKVFVDLHGEGLIYRDKRLVNWDPHFQTALSNLEVENREVAGHFWHFKYPLENGETYQFPTDFDENGEATAWETRDYISIATTRPETMLGDGAVAVHPDDSRYAPIVGKRVLLPLADRYIPIITDPYPDPEFGSGAVKITGAHDFNDYQVAKRNNLPLYMLMDEAGRMVQSLDQDSRPIMPEKYVGLDRFEARKAVVADIDALGLMIKVEDKIIQQPFGDRSNVVVEPMLTDQWYVDAETLAKPAIDAVREGRTRFTPETWEKTYFNWMENIEPWCISRQLWWGHRIPAWYGPDGHVFVALDETAAQIAAHAHYGAPTEIVQDEDVLDTWFSSALWPFSTQGWPDQTPDLKAFYPGAVLVTAFDIIFFWVARMMMMGLKFMDGQVPFHDVYIHAIVRDETGKKMSKSEGNVIDPVDLIEGIDVETLIAKRTSGLRQPQKAPAIAKDTRKRFPNGFEAYGADALRFTLAAMATKGRDINLSVDRVAGYRNFGTKLWNATRFAQMNDAVFGAEIVPDTLTRPVNRWIVGEVGACGARIDEALGDYRFNDAAEAIYHFVWDVFCDWYLELLKAVLQGDDEAQKAETRKVLGWTLDQIFKMLHPFSPFITETLWEQTASRDGFLMQQSWPVDTPAPWKDPAATSDIDWVVRLVSEIRSVRSDVNVPAGARVPVRLIGASQDTAQRVADNAGLITRLARLDDISLAQVAPNGAVRFVVDEVTVALEVADLIDRDAEINRLDKQLGKLDSEGAGLEKRLGNDAFIAKAPAEVVREQRQRLEEVQAARVKLSQARAQLAEL